MERNPIFYNHNHPQAPKSFEWLWLASVWSEVGNAKMANLCLANAIGAASNKPNNGGWNDELSI